MVLKRVPFAGPAGSYGRETAVETNPGVLHLTMRSGGTL